MHAHKKAKKVEKCRIVYIFALDTAKEGEKYVLQYKNEGKTAKLSLHTAKNVG